MSRARAESKQSSSSPSVKESEDRGDTPSSTSPPARGEGPLRTAAPAVALGACDRGTQDGLGVQPKLTVNEPDDEYEKEAERVAEAVMRQSSVDEDSVPISGIMRSSATGANQTIDETTAEQIESVKGGGRSLPPSSWSFFERWFGRDFSDVRVHRGPKADKLTRSIDAKAFTHGENIFFRSGSYKPETKQGKELVAHELTHVVQQRASTSTPVETLQRRGHSSQSRKSKAAGGPGGAAPSSKSTTRTGPRVDVNVDRKNGRIFVTVDDKLVAEAQPPRTRNAGVKVESQWNAESNSFRLNVVTTPGTEIAFSPGATDLLQRRFSRADVQLTSAPEPEPIRIEASPERRPVRQPSSEPGAPAGLASAAEPTNESASDGWSSVSAWVHGALDIAGFVPGYGEVADGLNAAIFLAEGRYGEAAISAAAMIPILGDVGKAGKWTVKGGKELSEAAAGRTTREFAETATERGGRSFTRQIAGTRGLDHSFDSHAAQWFGREVPRETHFSKWQKLIERASQSSKTVPWSVGGDETIGHLARIEGKNLFVQFFTSGPRAGELATAFVPKQSQLSEIYRLLRQSR